MSAADAPYRAKQRPANPNRYIRSTARSSTQCCVTMLCLTSSCLCRKWLWLLMSCGSQKSPLLAHQRSCLLAHWLHQQTDSQISVTSNKRQAPLSWQLRFQHPPFQSFVHLFVQKVTPLPPPTHAIILLFVHPPIHSSIHLLIQSLTHSPFDAFIHLSIHSFVYSFIRSLIHSFVRSFTHSSVRSFVRSFIHSFIHSQKRLLDLTCAGGPLLTCPLTNPCRSLSTDPLLLIAKR